VRVKIVSQLDMLRIALGAKRQILAALVERDRTEAEELLRRLLARSVAAAQLLDAGEITYSEWAAIDEGVRDGIEAILRSDFASLRVQ
jgi:hypothetical protein